MPSWCFDGSNSRLYVCSGGEVVGPGLRLPGPASCVAWAPGLLAVGGTDLALWDLATASLLWRRPTPGPVTSVAICGEVYAASGGQLHVFSMAGGAAPALPGDLVAAGAGALLTVGKKVKVRRAGVWSELGRCPAPPTAASVNSRTAAVACGRHILVWEGEAAQELNAPGPVTALALGPSLLAFHASGATLFEPARDYQAWAGTFTGARALLLASGPMARPQLAQVLVDAEAVPAAAAAAEPRRKRQRVAGALPGLELALAEPTPSLEQQLAVLGLPEPGPTSRLVSVAAALRQALHSGDSRLLENCLALSDAALVAASVRQLEAEHLLQLLTVLTTTLQLSPNRALQLLPWLSALLVHHAAYLLTVPQAKPLLAQLHQCIDQRLAPFRKLLKLNGRLTLLLNQLRPANALDLGEPAVFDENESSEEEEEEAGEDGAESGEAEDEF